MFAQFLKEKEYLSNLSPNTIKYLGFVNNRWEELIGEFPNKQNIKEFVIRLNQSKLSPFTINSYIRGMNSYLTWLHENDYLTEHLKIKKIKEGKRGVKVYTDQELKKFLNFHPRTFADHRLYSMICFALDTGCRIDEMLSLKRTGIDFDNLLVRVVGKGDKERVVPISIQLRKQLFKFLKMHEFDYVFPANHGDKIDYKTVLDQLKNKFWEDASWHRFRHSYATNYLKNGGNLIYLQRLLGHTDLTVTRMYVNESTEDLSLMHKKTSLLGRLK